MAVLLTLTVLFGLSATVSAQRSYSFSICHVLYRDGVCYPSNACPSGTEIKPTYFLFWNTCAVPGEVCCTGEPDEPEVDECQNHELCGRPGPTARLSFASNEVPRQSPWQVSIRRLITRGGGFTLANSFHSGGGALISRNFVLLDATAASRAGKLLATDNWDDSAIVVLGDYNTLYPEMYNNVPQEQIFRIKSVTYHPGYRYSTDSTFPEILSDSGNNFEYHQAHALCLIELATPVEFNDWVRPICLPPVEPTCGEYKDCRVTGWGIDETSQTNNILRVAHVEEFTKGGCEAIEFYGSGRSVVLPDGTNCAISLQSQTNPSLSYIGDFGGPVACDDVSNSYRTTLSGIMTFNAIYNQTNYILTSDVTSVISDWAWTTCRSKLG